MFSSDSQWFSYMTKPLCFGESTCCWERVWGITTTQAVIWNRKKETKLQIERLQTAWFFFPLKKKPCVFHLPPLVLYLYPDGLEFGGWWRELLFCHWLKAVNLINKKIQTKKTKTQKLAARIHIRREEACMHTNTQRVIMQTPHTKRQQKFFCLFVKIRKNLQWSQSECPALAQSG